MGPRLRVWLDPEDVLQEVCCRAYDAFPTFDRARGSFQNWIFGIANNVLREALRDLARRQRGGGLMSRSEAQRRLQSLPDSVTSIVRGAIRREEVQRLLDLADALPEEDRRLLLHRGLEGLSHARVAELLGLSEAGVRKRWERLRRELRGRGVSAELLTL